MWPSAERERERETEREREILGGQASKFPVVADESESAHRQWENYGV
jgi:hypothetical protein